MKTFTQTSFSVLNIIQWIFLSTLKVGLLLLLLAFSNRAIAQLMPGTYNPAVNSTASPIQSVSLRYFTNASLTKGSGNIVVTTNPGGLWESIAVSSASVVIVPATSPAGFYVDIKFRRPLPDGVQVNIAIPPSAFNSSAPLGFGGVNDWQFNTSPSGPILYDRIPAAGTILPSSPASITLDFHENISKGSGSILLKNKNTGNVLQSINVTSPAVNILTGAGSPRTAVIDLATAIPPGTEVILEMPTGIFKDAGNANSLAVNDTQTWFRVTDSTPPALVSTSPAHQGTINVTDRVVTFTFNEPVIRGTGNISFRNKANGTTIYQAPLYGGDVTQTGNTLTVTKPSNWSFGTEFFVIIPGTAIRDMEGNYWPGMSNGNDYNFTTCSSVNPTISIALTAGTNPSCTGQSKTFTATATNGGTSPSYQWKVNGANVGTNSATFSSSTLTNGQIVSCVLTSNATCASSATATSNNILVGITTPVTPTVTISTGSTNTCTGNAVTFTAAVTNVGSGLPTYQWKVDGVNVGSNQNFYSTSALTNGQVVTCVITRDNSGCITSTTATSNAITMTVGSAAVQPSDITGSTSVCQGSTSSYSVTNISGVSYLWDTGGAGTVSGSGNAVNITWNSSGAKTLTTYATNSCGTSIARTLTVTVNATPAQPSVIVGTTTAGQNQSTQYSVTNEPGTTYTWNAGSGGTVTGSGNAVSIIWTTAGTKIITVTPSTSCGSGAGQTLSVTVGASCAAPSQPSTIVGNTAACTASSGTYSVAAVGGVSYAWNAGVDGNVSGSGNSVTLNWTSIGTKTVTVTPFTDCGSGTARTLTVTVSALPAQPSTITGNITACFNSSNTYSVTNVSGVTYTWDTAGKGTVTGTGNSVSVQWTAAGTNVLTITPSNGCGNGLARTLAVTVSGVALGTTAIIGANLTCTGVSGSYSVDNVSGVSYAWTAGAGATITGSGNARTISWSSGGDKVVQVTPSNSCGSGSPTTLTVSVTATVAQPGPISGSTSVNAGATTTYSVTNEPGVTYQWSTSADGVIIPNGNSAQVSWTTGGSKTLTVTPSNVCGNGTVRSIAVNVATPCVIPTTPSSVIITSGGSTNRLVGETVRLQVTFSSGATSYDLSVSPSTGVTITPFSANTWDVTFTTPGAYSISGKGVSACGTSGPAVLPINVCTPSVSQPILTGSTANICPGSTTRYAVTSPIDGLPYEWLTGGAPGVTIAYLNAQRSIADITWNTNWTGVNISVRARNACNAVSAYTDVAISLVSKPAYPNISITPTGTLCAGNGSYIYTINLPEAGVDYNWILNGAGTVAGNKLSATIPLDGQSRTIKILGTNSCFVNEETASISHSAGIPLPLVPSPVVGPSTIDFNVDGTFTVEAQPVGVNFFWDAGTDAIITNTALPNSKLIRWSTGGTKTVYVNASNSCANLFRSYSLYVVGPCDAPAIPDSITGSSSGCANNEYTFSVPFQPNTTFNWSAGADATITGTGTTRNIKWSTTGSKTITVSATNGCTTSTSQTKSFTVLSIPAQPAGITGGSLACAGSTEVFTVNPVIGGITYAWEIQGGVFTTSGAQNENISITWSSAGSNIIKVKASNSCGFGPERSITRTISTSPLQPSPISGESEVCTNTSKPYSIANVPGTTYIWNGGTGATVTGSGNAVTISWSTAGAKTITVTPSTSCGSGAPRTMSVNVIGVPAQPAAIAGNASPVLGNAVAYSVTSVAGVNYTWSLTDKGILTASGNTSSVSWNSLGSATLTVTPSNLCGNGAARSHAITVNKIPQTITFTLASPVLANAEIALNGVSDAGLPVIYSSSNISIAEVQGNNLVINGTGTINITASQSGDDTCSAATNVVRSITINKANQTITFEALSATAYGSSPFNAAAYSDANLAITYTSSSPAVATVSNDGTISVICVGSTNITASQGGDAKYNSATSVVRALTVNKAAQTITFEPLAIRNISDPPFSLNGTASSGLALTYVSSNTSVAMVSGSTVIIVGEGSTTITASQIGNGNYNAASSVGQTLTINSKQSQTVAFGSLDPKTFGDANFNISASASSGLSVSFSSSNTAVATISGNVVTVVGAGSTTITAIQIGDATFNPATPIQQVLVVNKADQTITFDALGLKLLGEGVVTLSASSSSSGLPVSYTSSNVNVANVLGSELGLLGIGSSDITATQAGNSNYNAAIPVMHVLHVVNTLSTPAISITGNLDFGDVILPETKNSVLTITNSGNALLEITSIDFPSGFSGNIISGSIEAGASLSIVVTFAPTDAIDYKGQITITSNATLGESINVSGKGVLVTSLENEKEINSLNVFPNPGLGVYTIEIKQLKNTQVLVYDELGKTTGYMEIIPIGADQYQLDIRSMAQGVYYLRIHVERKIVVTRLIKIN